MKCRYPFIIVVIVLTCFSACKKLAPAPQGPATEILGKWYTTSHTSTLYSSGILLDTATRTTFTTDDFIEYFNDGSGILSSEGDPSASLSQFKYTISGQTLVQTTLSGDSNINETVIALTASSLSIHYNVNFTDSSTGILYNESDDYSFKR